MSLFESASAFLAANPLLVGGVGTLIFGSAMYLLRAVPAALVDLFARMLWTHVSVENVSNEYRDVDGFVERLRLPFFSRSLEIKDGALKTGFGGGWGVYGRTLFRYTKTKTTQQAANFETIAIAFLTRDRGVVERFMLDSQPDEHKASLNVALYTSSGRTGGLRRRKRGLDTVFVDQAIKDRLVSRLTWFVGAEDWHAQRGIPWKLGIVLHGPPGSGKTSLIHALASELGFDIKYIKSLQGLGSAFMSATKNDLFVIEDIDTLASGLTREPAGRDGAGASLSAALHDILNSMDGMQTPDGLKFIVTTNHLDRLDPAIIRPGRIDEVVEIGPLSLASARQMFRAFYGRDGITAYTPHTGARLQQMFSTMSADEAQKALAREAEGALAKAGAADR